MFNKNNTWTYSPTDLVTFMRSPFEFWMNRAVILNPDLVQLKDPEDEALKALQTKGYEHEDEVLANLMQSDGKRVIDIDALKTKDRRAETIKAMREGYDVIYQAHLALDPFAGKADFLIKVDAPSELGDFSYEVWDSKLAFSVKPYFIIQLCCYAQMVAQVQGVLPEYLGVILGDKTEEKVRTSDYYYYYLALKDKFLKFNKVQSQFDLKAIPDPFDSKEHGAWAGYAQQLLEERDHLSLIANINRSQIKKLSAAGITTCTSLRAHEGALSGMNPEILIRLREQSSLQFQSKGLDKPVFKILSSNPAGLASLPTPSVGDVFFDIEGYPLIEGGLEYLWGCTYFENGKRLFKDFWAHDRDQERELFIDFIAWIFERWTRFPDLHIYHYATYEITACKKLSQRFGVCEHEVDELLRHQVFVDLYKVVKAGLMVGEPRYSIKNIEHLYRAKRDTEVKSGGDSIIVYGAWYESWLAGHASADWTQDEVLKNIRDYNKDDCDSTQELFAWLTDLKIEHKIETIELVKDELNEDEPTEKQQNKIENKRQRTELKQRLLEQALESELSDEQKRLSAHMAHSLDFHERELKPMWWNKFERLGYPSVEDIERDVACIAHCKRTKTEPFKATSKARLLSYEYQFSIEQDYKPAQNSYYLYQEYDDNNFPVKLNLDAENSDFAWGIVTLKAKSDWLAPTEVHLIPDELVSPEPIPAALQRVVVAFDKGELVDTAIMDFLTRSIPRIKGHVRGEPLVTATDGKARLAQIIKVVENLDHSVLTIQGPPGTGKTYTASHIIAALLKQGKRIGISSNSHKAIKNLLLEVADTCRSSRIKAHFICTRDDGDDERLEKLGVEIRTNAQIADACGEYRALVVGTTAWGFAREDVAGQFDYLFVDEAGQVSVANLIAMSASATNLVLMGDQMQLGQPSQGTHPEDSGLSILDYFLGHQPTVEPEMGVFLDTTYRMHSAVNQFISEAVYEGKLKSASENDLQTLQIPSTVNEVLARQTAGIVFCPIEHEGNTQKSEEEAKAIQKLVKDLCKGSLTLRDGVTRAVTLDDMLFVAPYNAQVALLQSLLGNKAKVGSVDKFQGQQAPIVFFSLCASDANEISRGMEFLYNFNRINVAISRAQILAIVVGNPALFCPSINSVEQMKLVNLVSRLGTYADDKKPN